jgi:hypothetical protein
VSTATRVRPGLEPHPEPPPSGSRALLARHLLLWPLRGGLALVLFLAIWVALSAAARADEPVDPPDAVATDGTDVATEETSPPAPDEGVPPDDTAPP